MNKNIKNQITRKEALKKMGKYAALTAAGTFFILSPKASAQSSNANPPPNPGNGNGPPFGQ